MCATVRIRLLVPAMAFCVVAMSSGVACAEDEDPATIGIDGRPISAIGTTSASANGLHSTLTRFDSPTPAVRTLPGYRTDLTAVTYEGWASQGRAGVGIGIGGIALIDRPTGMVQGRDSATLTATSGTLLMLGLRYRTTADSTFYANTAHVSGLTSDDRLVSKVGVEFKAVQSNWNLAYGGLGLHLAGDSRMTVRVRRNGVGLFMKRAF